jgi:hypothetical protein
MKNVNKTYLKYTWRESVYWIHVLQDWLHWRAFVNTVTKVRVKILTAASITMAVFWDMAQRSIVEEDRNFRGAYSFHRGT